MNTSTYWHKLSKYLMIRTALPHLLLGVIAGFSCSDKSLITIPTSGAPVSMVVISVMAHQPQSSRQASLPNLFHAETNFYPQKSEPIYADIMLRKLTRTFVFNGIRAGPLQS